MSFLTTYQYLYAGIIIWFLKVVISYYWVQPSTATDFGACHKLFVMLVFFSPNVLFWPINLILDIYSLSSEYITPSSAKNLIHALVGF